VLPQANSNVTPTFSIRITIDITPMEVRVSDNGIKLRVNDNVSVIMDSHRILRISVSAVLFDTLFSLAS
jgi:hypothetical protein